ncbi:MAG: hypothetical protein Q9214_006952, partial [Letrouitia sp. 1 TL-2023]
MVDDETLAQFAAIIGTTPDRGRQYLELTDGDVEQAIELFFANGGAALGGSTTSDTTSPSHRPSISQPPTRPLDQVQTTDDGVIHIDSDSEPDDSEDDTAVGHRPRAPAPRPGQLASSLNTVAGVTPPSGQGLGSTDDDEAIARRLQEEMYGESGVVPEMDPQGIRAPIARTTETLIGPDSFDPNDPEDMNAAVQQQIRARDTRRTRGRPGIFNQDGFNSIWNDESSAPDSHRERLSRATAGASETSSKSRSLAEMYRPPYEIMSRLPWDQAREQGKESEKWILVNIQDPSIFDCQILNRDIWKDPGVVETVKENFIFMQYTKDDPRSNQYVQYYFQAHENQDAYPHIAIVDPRTGEQVKVWSGPSAPKAADFLMQLHEFLDRYSLKAAAKNPVAKRKPDVKKATQVNEMTEDQMLEMALQNSLVGQNPSQEPDPDDLTR